MSGVHGCTGFDDDDEALMESCLIQTEGACVDFLTVTAIKNLEALLLWTDLCYSDPLLYDAGPLSWCSGRPAGGGGTGGGICGPAEQGHDDLVGNGVELCNGGSNGGRHVFLLVSL